jgi:hypothetical protein
MNERDPVPSLLLRIDNLIRGISTLATELEHNRASMLLIEAHLANIERALAIPISYTVKQASKRLNMSLDWCYRMLPALVEPSSRDPLRFPVDKIDALALSRALKREEARVG